MEIQSCHSQTCLRMLKFALECFQNPQEILRNPKKSQENMSCHAGDVPISFPKTFHSPICCKPKPSDEILSGKNSFPLKGSSLAATGVAFAAFDCDARRSPQADNSLPLPMEVCKCILCKVTDSVCELRVGKHSFARGRVV